LGLAEVVFFWFGFLVVWFSRGFVCAWLKLIKTNISRNNGT